MKLTITYRNGQTESFKNIKGIDKANNILLKRGNVAFSMLDGKLFSGKKPVKPKRNNELTFEELEARIKVLG